MKELSYINTAKGIGILLVVIGHCVLDIPLVTHWIYSFHMPLFFFITGFLFAYKNEKIIEQKTLLIKKVKSLLYPYFTFSVIIVIFHFFFYNIFFTSSVPETETLDVFLLSFSTFGYHALWFVPCLFFATVIFSIIIKNKYHHFIIISITIFTLVYNSFYRFPTVEIAPKTYTYVFRIIMAISFIYLGYMFYNLLLKITKSIERLLLILSFCTSILLYILFLIFPDSFPSCNLAAALVGNPFVYHLTALSNCIWIILFCKNLKFPRKFIDFCGKNSFIIMALHMDITSHISWMVFALFPFSFNTTIDSIIVTIIQLFILSFLIIIINKYFPFIIKHPIIKKS